jgi:hypothetical protein
MQMRGVQQLHGCVGWQSPSRPQLRAQPRSLIGADAGGGAQHVPLHSGAGARAAAAAVAASGAFNVPPMGLRGGAARTASSASDPGGGGGGYGGAGDVRAFNNVMAWHRRTSLDNSALERPDMPQPGCAACGCARGVACTTPSHQVT